MSGREDKDRWGWALADGPYAVLKDGIKGSRGLDLGAALSAMDLEFLSFARILVERIAIAIGKDGIAWPCRDPIRGEDRDLWGPLHDLRDGQSRCRHHDGVAVGVAYYPFPTRIRPTAYRGWRPVSGTEEAGMMIRSYAADAILIVHFAYVAFVASGFLLIPLGAWRAWRWTRSVRYRVLHGVAIGYVACEQLLGITCPLTLWEYRLRGGEGAPRAFVPRLLQAILFHAWPPMVFTGLYLGLVALAVFYWWRLPPDHY